MTNDKNPDPDLRTMIADYMEKGFLDNIIDMFKHDNTLYALIGELVQDERIRVRIGITALMEELKNQNAGNLSKAVPNILPLLDHKDPMLRGDAANLLGIIGDRSAIPLLEKVLSDENQDVRLLAKEAIEEINRS